MGRSKKFFALALLLTAFSACEKESIDLPEENANELTFQEFLNSGIDFENYFRSNLEKEQNSKTFNKSHSEIFSPDEIYFNEFCGNLAVEDFEEAEIPVGSAGLVAAPLWEGSQAGKFNPGDIESGLIITTEDHNLELTVYGDGFRDSDTKLITSRRDQSLILEFTDGDVLNVGLDISSYPYPDLNYYTDQVTVEVYLGEGEPIHIEIMDASFSGTFWSYFADEPLTKIILSSTNNDAWVGVDNIAFGVCEIPDSDVDGCPDDYDQQEDSNLEASVIIGDCDTGVPNRSTSACGVSFSDLVDNLEYDIYKNKGAFVSEFAAATNRWISEGIITEEEKGQLMSCAAKMSI